MASTRNRSSPSISKSLPTRKLPTFQSSPVSPSRQTAFPLFRKLLVQLLVICAAFRAGVLFGRRDLNRLKSESFSSNTNGNALDIHSESSGFEAVGGFFNLPASSSLQQVHEFNQKTRNSVSEWIKKEEWDSPPSFFNYGLPAHVFDLVNVDVGPDPIGHDMISFFGLQMKKRIAYLEIGVSVGKCLFTQLHLMKPPSVVYALDIEDINPTLAGLLEFRETKDHWRDEKMIMGVESQRRSVDDSIKVYKAKASGTALHYIASDEFNLAGWERLGAQGERFNLIYSDAMHNENALKAEMNNLLSHSLIDLIGGYTMLWDDCDGDLQQAFFELVPQMKDATLNARSSSSEYAAIDTNSNFCFGVFEVHGWLGRHEAKHRTCMVTTINLLPILSHDKTFQKLNWVSKITCD